MITAHELHRLITAILLDEFGSFSCPPETVDSFARHARLDAQDTATLWRLVAGENVIATTYQVVPA